MYCFDTSVVVDLFRGNDKIRTKIEDLEEKGHKNCISSMTLCELYAGAYKSPRKEQALQLIQIFIANIDLLLPSVKTAKEFGKNYAELKSKGKLIPQMDLLIGSTAKAQEKILITKDKKHFKHIPNLKVEVW